MPELSLVLNGKPEPQLRPRITKFVSFDPCKDKKNWAKLQIAQQIENTLIKPIEEPLEIVMIFHMPIPKSTSKKKRELMLSNCLKHTKKSDIDNLYKFFSDAMNGLLYKDDSQIWRVEMEKVYSEDPRTEITLIW